MLAEKTLMNTTAKIAAAGAILGFLETFSIWFVPEEPYPTFIVFAGVLKGGLTALLVAGWINRSSSVIKALTVGGLFGFLMGTVVFLAKGGWSSFDAPFVVATGVVVGLLIGLIVRRLNEG